MFNPFIQTQKSWLRRPIGPKMLSFLLLVCLTEASSSTTGGTHSKRTRVIQSGKDRVSNHYDNMDDNSAYDDDFRYYDRSSNQVADDNVFNQRKNEVLNSSLPANGGLNKGYWKEVRAILGGVLGFWGGVGGLGAVFLTVVISQRYCCKKNYDKDGNG